MPTLLWPRRPFGFWRNCKVRTELSAGPAFGTLEIVSGVAVVTYGSEQKGGAGGSWYVPTERERGIIARLDDPEHTNWARVKDWLIERGIAVDGDMLIESAVEIIDGLLSNRTQ